MNFHRWRETIAFALSALVPALFVVAALAFVVPAATSAAELPDCSGVDPSTVAAATAECIGTTPIVPSLDPEWSESFVPPPMHISKLGSTAACRPLSAVFYAPTDWFRLAQKLRGDPSLCADYYVSVPPLAADKTQLRNGEAARIRGLGPQMHAVAEINVSGWTTWVAAGNGTWFDAGVEARRRMATAGFDVGLGDIWAVNEFSSAVRTGTGAARANMRELVRGLHTGDGTGANVQGVVWVIGIGQATADLSTYKTNLKAWYQDAAFWADMSLYVRFWSQEVFGDVRKWAVPGADLPTRRDTLVDFVEHQSVLSHVSPPPVAGLKAFIEATDTPLANAAWTSTAAFGFTSVPSTQMQAYVASQTHALRSYQAQAAWRDGDSFGFAWSPQNGLALTSNQFTSQTAGILDRLAASIHASDAPNEEDPGVEACGPDTTWCATDIDEATFNPAWRNFGTWTQPAATDSIATVDEDTPAPISLVASDPDGEQLTYELVAQPQHGALTGGGATRTYAPDHNFNGVDSFTFRVSDGVMLSRVATVQIAIKPVNDAPTLELGPAGPVDEGGPPATLTATATDVEGDAVTYSWASTVGAVVPAGDTATFAATDGPATAHVTVTGDDGHGGIGTATIAVDVRNVAPTAEAVHAADALWGLPVNLTGSATDPGADDTATGLVASWDFGDGSPAATGFAASHAYAAPGTYTATLTATDKDGDTGTDTATVTVRPRQATIAYAGTSGLEASAAMLSARLGDAQDATSARLGGHLVSLLLGTQRCTATTDATGLMRCAVNASALSLGPATVRALFDGDELYTTASVSAPVVLYALPATGVFVVGDLTATGQVTFWSPKWSRVNTLSGGPAPARFKGFASRAGGSEGSWIASAGADGAPQQVPQWMGVAVATTATSHGSTIRGDTKLIVVVHVDRYSPSVIGKGTVVATGS